MKKFSSALLLAICLPGLTVAQDRTAHPNSADSFERFTRELFLLQQNTQPAQVQEAAAGRAAQYNEQQFLNKVNRFVGIWDRFVAAYNERKAFDFKTAKELSKAFHQLESSGDWPQPDQK